MISTTTGEGYQLVDLARKGEPVPADHEVQPVKSYHEQCQDAAAKLSRVLGPRWEVKA